MENAFLSLKKVLISALLLAFPDFDAPFIVEADASGVMAGAVLERKGTDEKVHLIYFAIMIMSNTKKLFGL